MSSAPRGLRDLGSVPLTPASLAMLEPAAAFSLGPAAWRARKLSEARELLALAQIAPRLEVLSLDLIGDLRARVRLACPVPCRLAASDAPLEVLPQAELGVTYPFVGLSRRLPGFAFIEVLEPRHVWIANVSPGPVQQLCLGAEIAAAGTPLRELLLMAYGALTLQLVQVDQLDPAGVLNPAAALFWQGARELTPLSREPFLAPCALPPGGAP